MTCEIQKLPWKDVKGNGAVYLTVVASMLGLKGNLAVDFIGGRTSGLLPLCSEHMWVIGNTMQSHIKHMWDTLSEPV